MVKSCGVRKSKAHPNVYSKSELVELAMNRLNLSKSAATKLKMNELCIRLFGKSDALDKKEKKSGEKKDKKTSDAISLGKVCTPRKTRKYPNAYKKEDLIELAIKNLKWNKTKAKKYNIRELCNALNIEYIDLDAGKEEKKQDRKEEKKAGPSIRDLPREVPPAPLPPPASATEEKKEAKRPISVQEICIDKSKLPLKEHQKKVVRHIRKNRGLIVVHSVGSGKTLTAVTAMQCYLSDNPKGKVVIITPTSLMNNFKKEIEVYGSKINENRMKFFTLKGFLEADKKGKGMSCSNTMLIIDEAHNLRTEMGMKNGKEQGVVVKTVLQCAKQADKVLLLTATPAYNYPSDFNNLLAMIEGRDPYKKKEFEQFLESDNDIKRLFNCKTSFYKPDEKEMCSLYPSSSVEEVFIPMTKSYEKEYMIIEESNFEEGKCDRLGSMFDLEANLGCFYNGVRRASNNLELTKSPKIDWIIKHMKKSKPKEKYVLFSHFLEAGMELMMKVMDENKISYAHIDGSKTQGNRSKAVKDYNDNKIKVLLISKAGGEGLDLKETRYIILLEPSWNKATVDQVIGRGIRCKSHINLPKDQQVVTVYKLYHIKNSEYEDLENIINNNLTSIENGLLSIDLYLRNLSIRKQAVVDNFLDKVRALSIENQNC